MYAREMYRRRSEFSGRPGTSAPRHLPASGCPLPPIPDQSVFNLVVIVVVMTAGTGVIMWLGELITERAECLPMFTYVKTYGFSRQLNFKPYPDELPRFYLSSWK